MQKSTAIEPLNSEKPIYTPSILMMRDDEMINSNVGIFYDAPGAKDEDYYAFLVLKNMFGSYRIDQNAEHMAPHEPCSNHPRWPICVGSALLKNNLSPI